MGNIHEKIKRDLPRIKESAEKIKELAKRDAEQIKQLALKEKKRILEDQQNQDANTASKATGA